MLPVIVGVSRQEGEARGSLRGGGEELGGAPGGGVMVRTRPLRGERFRDCGPRRDLMKGG